MKKYFNYLYCISAILFIIGSIFIYNHKTKICYTRITNPQGITKKIRIPFVFNDGNAGMYKYEIDLQNFILFSGEVQIIPVDCVNKITINDYNIPDYFIMRDSCDNLNGFYLNTSKFLKKGNNSIILELTSLGNKYGINFRDTTRYDFYFIYLAFICFVPLLIIKYLRRLNFKQIWTLIINYRKWVLFSVCLAGGFLWIIHTILIFKTQIEYIKPTGTKKQVSFPYVNELKVNDTSIYRVTLYNYMFFPTPVKIITEGCIQSLVINNNNANSLLSQYGFYNWNSEFNNTLNQFLKTGKNEIIITLCNKPGDDCKNFIINVNNYCIIIYLFYLLLLLSPMIYLIYKKYLYGKYIVLLFVISIFLWLRYSFCLPYNAFSHDIREHLQYINYIFERNHIPISSGGWSFFHPPLYFLSTAFIWHITTIFGFFSEIGSKEILQIFSLLLFIIYSYFSIKSFDLIFRKHFEKYKNAIDKRLLPLVYLPVIGIFLCWPSNVIHSVRIGNDIMLYTFYAIAFYFILKWYFLKDIKNLTISLIFTSLAIWSKTNAMILFAIIGLLLIYHFITDKDRKIHFRKYFLKLALLLGFAVVSIYFAFNEKFKNLGNNLNTKILVDNVYEIPKKYWVENNLPNFLFFNPVKFIETTFTNPVENEKGRQSFWFYLFKTSLFGEFSFEKPVSMTCATLINLLFLLLLIIIITGITVSFFDFKINAPFTISIIVLLGSMIVFRIISPTSTANDFRFIFPAVTTFAYFTGITGLFLVRKNKVLCLLLMLIPVLFILSSLFFQFTFIIII